MKAGGRLGEGGGGIGREEQEEDREEKTTRVNKKPETGKIKQNDAEVTQDKADDMCISRKTL